MKNIFQYILQNIFHLTIVFFICSSFSAFGNDFDRYVNVRNCVFHIPGEQTYIESSISVYARTLKFEKLSHKKYQAKVEVQLFIKNADGIVKFDKYIVKSPIIADTLENDFNVLDIKRIEVPAEVLTVEVTITDLNEPRMQVKTAQAAVATMSEGVEISDVQFLESYKPSKANNIYVRNNVEMKPYPMNFFPDAIDKLIYYSEIYNTDKLEGSEQFLVTAAVRSAYTDKILNRYGQYQKKKTGTIIPVLNEIDISNLPSGNYELIIEARDKSNKILKQKIATFTRLNKGAVPTDLETLAQLNVEESFVAHFTLEEATRLMQYIYPISNESEDKAIQALIESDNLDMKKKFLHNFWLKRDPDNPASELAKYLVNVKKTNDNYSTTSKQGYRTDRGRVYLKYGEPNDIVISNNEPGAAPYQIWHYYRLADGQNNIKFVFYEPSIVTNDFALIHSDARGELQDPRWKLKLYERVIQPSDYNDFDNVAPRDHFGGNADRYFDE